MKQKNRANPTTRTRSRHHLFKKITRQVVWHRGDGSHLSPRRARLNISQAQHKAAGEMVELIASKIGKGRAIHPETAISASARLSGSLLLRSFNLNLDTYAPGAIVLSHESNKKVPVLINSLSAYLSALIVQLDQQKLGSHQAWRGGEPQLDILGALTLLQESALQIGENKGK